VTLAKKTNLIVDHPGQPYSTWVRKARTGAGRTTRHSDSRAAATLASRPMQSNRRATRYQGIVSLLNQMTVRDKSSCNILRDFSWHAKSTKAMTLSVIVPHKHNII
jgi:hypothetical protein